MLSIIILCFFFAGYKVNNSSKIDHLTFSKEERLQEAKADAVHTLALERFVITSMTSIELRSDGTMEVSDVGTMDIWK